MSELLMELYSEEIPSDLLEGISNKIKNSFGEILMREELIENPDDNFCKIYTTPCRIIICADNLPTEIKIKSREIVGPKTDSSEDEIDGFLKAFELKSTKELNVVDGNYIFLQKNFKASTKEILQESMGDILNNINYALGQNVRWYHGGKEYKWISPLRNILCLLDGHILKFEHCGLPSTNYTYGHKTIVGFDKKITVKNFEDYSQKMEENFVIFDQNKRRKIIEEKISEIEKKEKLSVLKNNEINPVEKAINGAEYPDVLLCEFDLALLKLPPLVIINTICVKYNCLCLVDTNRQLTNKFILFANTKTTNGGKNIIAGIESAVNGKLRSLDEKIGKFLSENMDIKIQKLREIPYHRGFGTLYNKVERLVELSRFICLWVPHSNLMDMESAAKLSKIDLTTNLTKENVDLRGHLSAHYAKNNGYAENICIGINEHYSPKDIGDTIPTNDIGKILSLADMVDNVITLFITNEDPTKSKYTYNIRKEITLIIKLLVEGGINIPINILLHKSISLFNTSTYKINRNTKISVKQQIVDIKNNALDIFKKRFVSYAIENSYYKNIVLSITNVVSKAPINISAIYRKIDSTSKYIEKHPKKFNLMANSYKRLDNILGDFKPKKSTFILFKIFQKKYYPTEQEKDISEKIKEIKENIKEQSKLQNYDTCLDLLFDFSPILNEYFKNNLIKSDDEKQTYARLFLLYRMRKVFDSFLNFKELQMLS